MSNDRRDDRDQDNSAEDWNPWQDEDSSEDDLPSFSHDSDEEEADFRRYDETSVRDPLDEDEGGDGDGDEDDESGSSQLDSEPPALAMPPVSPVRAAPPAYKPQEEAFSSEDEADDYDDVDSWDEEEPQDDEYRPTEASRFTDTWPVGLIAVAALALVLLAAGGYGVMKQRAAMEQEIRDLQALLAVAAKPEEISSTRASLGTLEEDNRELRTTLAALRDENRQLSDTLAGLEQQLVAQRDATARAAPAPAKPQQAVAQATPAPDPAATAGGDWFVNFSSYSERSVAEQWAARLQPASGQVTVTATQRDGTTLYRVRVIGLASDSQAQTVARKLEQDYGLSKLWVGRE
ncbi:MAG: SPOR domain-containing protein [Haliea sp.]|uniref:SPOR domain-containing protein n=1 Tax=Haliea sp. TaxID=1932666 RepID=UPI0032F03ABA